MGCLQSPWCNWLSNDDAEAGGGCVVGAVGLALGDLQPLFRRRLVCSTEDHVMEYLFFIPIGPLSGMDGRQSSLSKEAERDDGKDMCERLSAEDVGIGGWQIAS
jgi:hypothetical protein